MNSEASPNQTIRFSIFEIDRTSGEMFRQGRRVKLQGQPFQLLLALVERPGQVITREELRQKVWPSENAGDFDNGLNRAINKLRDALGDAADTPRFIETLPRRGYRFIASIQDGALEPSRSQNSSPSPESVSAPSTVPLPKKLYGKTKIWLGIVAAGLLTLAFSAVWVALHRNPLPPALEVRQLTTNSPENLVWNAVISPDGNYLALGDSAGIQVRLIATGESHLLPKPDTLSPSDPWFPTAWFPDGTRILANSVTKNGVAAWTVSLVGGAATSLGASALLQSVSPNGLLIAYTIGTRRANWLTGFDPRSMAETEIWLMNSTGENKRKIVSTDNSSWLSSVRWSPNGHRIAYQRIHQRGLMAWDYQLESCDLNGGSRSIIFSTQLLRFSPGISTDLSFPTDFTWLPDGRIIFALPEAPPDTRNTNLWRIAVNSETGKPEGTPQRISNLVGFNIDGLSATANGKELVVESSTAQSHIEVGQLEPNGTLSNIRQLTSDQSYNSPLAWMPDSKAILFNSDRTGKFSIYSQRLDQAVPELIPTVPGDVQLVRLSPDRKSLIYYALTVNPELNQLTRAPLAGGAPEALFSANVNNLDCPRRAGLPCIISEGNSYRQLAFFAFDPASGARRPLFRIERSQKNVNWTISPNGSRLAMTGTDPQGRIEIRSLDGTIESRIQTKDWSNLSSIDWAADGKTLFVASTGLSGSPSGPIGITLLRVDLQGHVQPIWQSKGGRYAWSIASPDSRYLAICEPSTERNAWIIKKF